MEIKNEEPSSLSGLNGVVEPYSSNKHQPACSNASLEPSSDPEQHRFEKPFQGEESKGSSKVSLAGHHDSYERRYPSSPEESPREPVPAKI